MEGDVARCFRIPINRSCQPIGVTETVYWIVRRGMPILQSRSVAFAIPNGPAETASQAIGDYNEDDVPCRRSGTADAWRRGTGGAFRGHAANDPQEAAALARTTHRPSQALNEVQIENPTGLPAYEMRPDGLMINGLLPAQGWEG